MNEKEKFGCIELLRKLSATDLKGLHQTVTKNILPSVEKNGKLLADTNLCP